MTKRNVAETVSHSVFRLEEFWISLERVNLSHWSSFIVQLLCRIFYLEKKNSVALVRERTIPTERSPLVGEDSVNFC
jgi:hypothetical protein